jgi:SAM-dependent methyltransferase
MITCIVCNNKDTKRVIEMGMHPLADTFLTKKQLINPQKFYPLNCLLCQNCGHLQNEIIVSGNDRYIDSNYSYTSSNSPSAKAHWDEFSEDVESFTNLELQDVVIEFGSNDGYLLEQFKKKGANVVGIDPSPAMSSIANKNGIFTVCDFISKKSIKNATKRYGKAKIIIGNNVLNHVEYLNEAIIAIKSGLSKDGILVIEVPSLLATVQKYLFDMIFHEHISTFSIKSIDYLLRKHGLYIIKTDDISYHGGSHRIYAGKDPKKYNKKQVDKKIASEEKSGIFKIETYQKFMKKIIKDKNDCLTTIYKLKNKNKKIAAVGAGARSNTLLNFYKFDPTILDFVTDGSIHKIGKFTPGSNIAIKDDKALFTEKIDVSLITAWNIGKYLTQKIKKISPSMHFVVPGEKELM